MVDLKKFQIPLEEIKLATDNFNPQRCIGGGISGKVYKGQLQRYGNRTVAIKRHDPIGSMVKNDLISELQIVSSLYHPNIITFIGYCEEDNEMIMVYEHAMNGSLDHHLYDENKSYARLRWAQRLKICIGAAKGLEYLHSGLEDNHRLIHRNIKSSIILLNENLEAKISGFCLSVLVPGNPRHTQAYTGTAGTWNSIISESSILMQEKKDVYAFGVLLFEMLSGMWDYSQRKITDDQPQNLITLVRRYYDQGLDKLIDPYIRNYIDSRSLNKFNEIAYKCISFNIKDRPSISFIIEMIQEALDIHQQESLEKFLIPLENINKATNEFIGKGGYGKVYKGKLPGCWENHTVAIKFMIVKDEKTKKVFFNELKQISSCHHQNIIPFIGFCDEGEYMTMVFEYAINGSLDDHLENPDKRRCINWAQRLKICLGVAKGINYLHSGRGVANRVIHRDLKSGNILLDENMEAKICDFGLARSDLDNVRNAPIQTSVAGTRYYTDPAYYECGRLVKESDVYSLGVVMFELLTGMLAYQYKLTGPEKRESLISLVRGCCYKDGFHELIDPYIRGHADSHSINVFKETAYSCIVLDTTKRPTMELVIKRIEEALNIQVSFFN
ncbi:Protein kinase, ATP binding site-containing protein [Artemisia annua]|uniref:Protein kinase, ATP binding site-containing protein n=1 Tax=Artemisia annua TaxID=35608 RepID=A0A2U1NN81_ARTAN|nr:Protein kinase, ATP binding site-containing protein [Artemisia annua]